MVTSETEICNSALIKIGAQRILSIEDNSERARLLKEQYHKLRDELLYSHPWGFAISRATLAEDVTSPEFEWSHRFLLPLDCLRVISTDIPKDNGEWAIEDGRYLMCHYSTVKIKYVKRITDVSKFTPGFAELLACAIAKEICYSITQSVTLRDSMLKQYERALATTRSFNAQESQGERVYADSWLHSRR